MENTIKMNKKKKGGLMYKFGVWDVIIYIVMITFSLIALYPFVYTLAGSLSYALDITRNGPVFLIPRQFSLASYHVVLIDGRLYRSLLNTVVSTIGGTVLGLTVTSGIAYALASKRLVCKKFFWTFNIIPMFISGGMIPLYITIRMLGLFNNYLVYIIPSAYSVFNMIILSSFFRGIDDSLYESAILDGASELKIWISIYLPLAKPALVTVALWIAVGKWNSYMQTMLYTNREESMWLLQFYLMRLIKDGDVPSDRGSDVLAINSQTLSFAAIIISSLPIMVLYPILSKYFTKGIMLGAVKG